MRLDSNRVSEAAQGNPGSLTYVIGDATQPVELNPTRNYSLTIAHGCNNINLWGAGFVIPLAKRFPRAKTAYHRWFEDQHRKLFLPILGGVQIVDTSQRDPAGVYISIANMITQDGIMGPRNPMPFDYTAYIKCLEYLGKLCKGRCSSVHMPMIGSGLGGGDWNKIELITEKILVDKYSRDVVIYKLKEK